GVAAQPAMGQRRGLGRRAVGIGGVRRQRLALAGLGEPLGARDQRGIARTAELVLGLGEVLVVAERVAGGERDARARLVQRAEQQRAVVAGGARERVVEDRHRLGVIAERGLGERERAHAAEQAEQVAAPGIVAERDAAGR